MTMDKPYSEHHDKQHTGVELWQREDTLQPQSLITDSPKLLTDGKNRHLKPLEDRPDLNELTSSPAKSVLPPIQHSPKMMSNHMMDRQNSTTPLVGRQGSLSESDAGGTTPRSDSPTSTKTTSVNDHGDKNHQGDKTKILTNGIVRKHSQVQPIPGICKKEPLDKIEECGHVNKDQPATSCGATTGKVITSLLVGIWFGWFLQKSTVYKPEEIRGQFVFERFVMLKTFIGALTSSQLVLLLMAVIPKTKPYIEAAKRAYTCSMKDKGVISTVLGAFILGSGMAVAGACPGMVLAQVGTLVPNSAYTVIGGIVGCVIYGLLHKFIIKLSAPNPPYETLFIHEKLNLPFAALALPCFVMCVVGITLMEVFIPETVSRSSSVSLTTSEGASLTSVSTTMGALLSNSTTTQQTAELTYGDSSNWFTREMWVPSACGVMIGLIQIPIVLVVSDTMGSSSAYQTIASQWVVTSKLQTTFSYMAGTRTGMQNLWMVVYVFGVLGGAALAALTSNSFFAAKGVVWWQALVGGFLMLFGSRLASGCTSGHGISGAALLVGLSWLAVPAMFAGAIATMFFMKYTNLAFYSAQWEPVIS